MSQQPPENKKPELPTLATVLTRTTTIASGVAVGAVVLFLLVYFGMKGAGVAEVPRVIAAFCVPPAIVAIAIGGYWLRRGGK